MKNIVDDNKQSISRPLALSTINLGFYEMISSKVGNTITTKEQELRNKVAPEG